MVDRERKTRKDLYDVRGQRMAVIEIKDSRYILSEYKGPALLVQVGEDYLITDIDCEVIGCLEGLR